MHYELHCDWHQSKKELSQSNFQTTINYFILLYYIYIYNMNSMFQKWPSKFLLSQKYPKNDELEQKVKKQ